MSRTFLVKKSCRAVTGSFPEQSTDEDTASNDLNMIANLAARAGLLDSLAKKDIHRHGLRKEGRPKIIKVPFKDVRSRDHFIRQFNRLHLPEMKFPNCSVTYWRDLSPMGLQLHYKKKLCYQTNDETGELRYYYKDLDIYECRKPCRQSTSRARAQ